MDKEKSLAWLYSSGLIRKPEHLPQKVKKVNGRAETECDGTRKRTGGEVKGKKANGGGSQQSCTVSDTVYPALLPLMRTPRLPAADWTDTPADINGLVRFAGKPSLVSARVPSRSVSAPTTRYSEILRMHIFAFIAGIIAWGVDNSQDIPPFYGS